MVKSFERDGKTAKTGYLYRITFCGRIARGILECADSDSPPHTYTRWNQGIYGEGAEN